MATLWACMGTGCQAEYPDHGRGCVHGCGGDASGAGRTQSPALLRVPTRRRRYILVDTEQAHVESSMEDPAYDHDERVENEDALLMTVW
jgi:hypothetical protein